MKLQRENRFKKMILSAVSKSLIVGGIAILGFSFFPNVFKYFDVALQSNQQNQVVAEAINPEYEEIMDKVNSNDDTVIGDTVQDEFVSKYDFNKLKETNPNIVAVIEGSCFDGGYYPIVSTSNNDDMTFYTRHSIDQNYSTLGTLFTDYSSTLNDQVVRIWGHNFHSNEKKMFTGVANICQNQEAFDQTLKSDDSLKLYTENGVYDLDVAACIVNDPRNQVLGNYADQDQFVTDMEYIQNASVIDTDVQINPNDQIVILSTCTNEGSLNDPYNRISVYCKASPELVKVNARTL